MMPVVKEQEEHETVNCENGDISSCDETEPQSNEKTYD